MNPEDTTPQPNTNTNPEASLPPKKVNDITPLNDIQRPEAAINSPSITLNSAYTSIESDQTNTPASSDASPATSAQPLVSESEPSTPTQIQSPFEAPIASGPSNPSAEFQPDDAPKKKKKVFIIAGIIALLVVLLGGGIGAYALWYTNPDKVMLDAVTNSIKAKTTVTEGNFVVEDTANKGKISVTFSSENDTSKYAGMLQANAKIEYDEFDATIAGAGMVSESGDIYFRVDNAKELLDKALETEYGKIYQTEPSFQSPLTKIKAFVTKIDGKWIKIDKSQIEESVPEYDEQQKCYKKTFDTFYKDNAQQQQVIKAYQENKFITVKDTGKSQSINGADSVGYDLSFDVEKGNAFGKALEKTDLIKALEKCGDGDSISFESMSQNEIKDAQKQFNNMTITVWISRWGHELQKVENTYKEEDSNVTFDMILDYSKKPNLKDPSGALDAKELASELEVIYTELFSSSLSTEPALPASDADMTQDI